MESNIWKTCGEKNLKFFESRLEFLYFDMLKNEGRGSNRLGVKKSFVTQIVRYRSKTIKLKNVVFELNDSIFIQSRHLGSWNIEVVNPSDK